MGFCKSWLIIFVIFSSLLLSMANDSKTYDPDSLQELFHRYANETLSKQHTGRFYNLTLPSNSSGMQVSVIRLRSSKFWARGVNFSSLIRIPPRVIAMPSVKRIALLHDNLGNLSSYYYKVPNHSLVAPVVGFSAYDASDSSNLSDQELTLTVTGDPISILFPDIVLKDKNLTLKCVKFGAGMAVEFSNMTVPNECTVTNGPGHFSVVVPFQPQPQPKRKKKKKEERSRKGWVIGFVGGFVGLVLLILVGVAIFKLVRRKMIQKMESESEKAVPLDTTWIGRSGMPSASMIRTQPALEHEYVP